MSRPRISRPVASLLLVLLAASSGCIKFPDFTTSKKTIDFYVVEYPPPEPLAAAPLAGVVLLRRLTAASIYGTDRMVTRGPMFLADFSYYRRWAATPASMVTDLLYRDLSDSGLFTAVLGGPGFLRPQYEISGTLELIEAQQGLAGWRTALTVNMLFFPYARDRRTPVVDRIFQKRYDITSPCKDGSAESIVASLSGNMQAFSREFIRDLQTYLQRAETMTP